MNGFELAGATDLPVAVRVVPQEILQPSALLVKPGGDLIQGQKGVGHRSFPA